MLLQRALEQGVPQESRGEFHGGVLGESPTSVFFARDVVAGRGAAALRGSDRAAAGDIHTTAVDVVWVFLLGPATTGGSRLS